MKNKRWRYLLIAACSILLVVGSSCSDEQTPEGQLDPDHPVTVVLWNYYNSQTKAAFDNLVAQFNDTVGMKKGIIVESVSHGDVQQLSDQVYAAAERKLGTDSMPHIFAAYPDNAYRVDQLGSVANLDQYFTAAELSEYRQDFLRDCRYGADGGLKQIPAVRSTEILYLNKTDWNKFAQATGTDSSLLSTWEGVAEAAKRYYEWTDLQTPEEGDGKAFLGIDSIATYMFSASIQLGMDIYTEDGQETGFRFEKQLAKKIWENLYIPFIRGYYANIGRFRSDDEKTGDILAYIGSSAGAQFFPLEVSLGQGRVYPIDSETLPYPRFADGEPAAIGQGAGFAVSKSDPVHEYASVVFLKWFTAKEQNTAFAVASGYLPVKNDALERNLSEQAEKYNEQYGDNPAVAQSIHTTEQMIRTYKLYSNRPFQGSYELRRFMDRSLLEFVAKNMSNIEYAVAAGTPRAEAVAQYSGEDQFEEWYRSFMNESKQLRGQ